MKKKYILVHSGARDQYKVAEYLYKNDKLAYFVTDDIFLRKNYKNLIPSNLISISIKALIFRVLEKLFPSLKFNKLKDGYLSKKAGNLSLRKHLPIFSYSYYGKEAFKKTDQHPKILFQLHPHPLSVKKILEHEININPLSKNSLSQEIELKYTLDEFLELTEESRLADFFIVASSFTKKTLIENGINENKIEVVPYGVDITKYTPRKSFRKINKGDHISLLFVGSFNQRKGLSYLLQAVSELQAENINLSLTLCGRGIMDLEIIDKYNLLDFKYFINIPQQGLVRIMNESDVFVFPSLCEGFGLVILEAMATGLPVITTDRTSGVDFIENGIEGYIIEAQNVEMIKTTIMKFVNNPLIIKEMGLNAINKSKQFTWDLFGERLINSIEKFENYDL